MSKKLQVSDMDVSDVVKDMADVLNIGYEVNHNEYCLRIPEHLGKGYVKATKFDHGIGVVETDYLLKDELHFELQRGVVHPLKIIFNRQSSFTHEFTEDETPNMIRRLESCIVSSTPTNNHVFRFPANKPICIFSLEINRKLFEERIESFLPKMNDDLSGLFRDVNGINKFYYKGNYTLEISEFLEQFTDCDLEGFMKSVFLEGKASEILVHQLQQYLDDLNEPDKRKILRQSTIEKVLEAVGIIQEELESIDNITVLAKRVGLNQNTLQAGFKHLYKASVKEYIRDYRIEKAKELLETTSLNITEITYKIGINSRSYFSKIFKKKYGISPKVYLKKMRSDKSA